MTLPVGQISLSQVNTELVKAAGAVISLNDAAVRTLAAKPSGIISMNDLRGKTSIFSVATSTQGGQLDVRTIAVNSGWNQQSKLSFTINNHTYPGGRYAPVLVTGNFPNGLNLIIGSGVWVVGRGGDGGTNGGGGSSGLAAIVFSNIQLGGPAYIYNYGQIAGGGGGGAGGATSAVPWSSTTPQVGKTPGVTTTGTYYYGGGGGGGGASYGSAGAGVSSTNGTGNAGGAGSLTGGGGGGAGSNGNPGGAGGGVGTASSGAAGAAISGSGVVGWPAGYGSIYGALA